MIYLTLRFLEPGVAGRADCSSMISICSTLASDGLGLVGKGGDGFKDMSGICEEARISRNVGRIGAGSLAL